MRYVCVFCGSSAGTRPAYVEAACAVGAALAAQGLGLVYGGSKVGLMGAVADATLAAGGEAIGVIPEFLAAKEIAHTGLTQLHVVRSMHERKALMADLADAFVALPGGYGTLEELLEILTWGQLGLHRKPIALLNTEGYYDPLLGLFDHAMREGFLSPALRGLALQATDPTELIELLRTYRPQAQDKWSEQRESEQAEARRSLS